MAGDDFGVARSELLKWLGAAMLVPDDRQSALLGRFQHLQRLKLIEGINPGRGKAATYGAHQVVILAVALQMLQLGLSPERAVHTIRLNQDRLRHAIGLAVNHNGQINPSVIWFDPAAITLTFDDDDLAEATFDFGGLGTGAAAFKDMLLTGWVQRLAFISVSGTLFHLVAVLEQYDALQAHPQITERSRPFLSALYSWHANSSPDDLT